MRVARFRVMGRLDSASVLQEGVVLIDRLRGVVMVRPKRRRRTYDMLLGDVADLICRLVIRAELAEKRRRKAEARKQRRRAR